jgi:hypothetical protein
VQELTTPSWQRFEFPTDITDTSAFDFCDWSGNGCGPSTITDNARSPMFKIYENIPGNNMPSVTDAEKVALMAPVPGSV